MNFTFLIKLLKMFREFLGNYLKNSVKVAGIIWIPSYVCGVGYMFYKNETSRDEKIQTCLKGPPCCDRYPYCSIQNEEFEALVGPAFASTLLSIGIITAPVSVPVAISAGIGYTIGKK